MFCCVTVFSDVRTEGRMENFLSRIQSLGLEIRHLKEI